MDMLCEQSNSKANKMKSSPLNFDTASLLGKYVYTKYTGKEKIRK